VRSQLPGGSEEAAHRRAHTSLIEHLKVDYYGSEVPLQQVASIAVEEGRTLVFPRGEEQRAGDREGDLQSDLGSRHDRRTVIRFHASVPRSGAARYQGAADDAENPARGTQRAPDVMNDSRTCEGETWVSQTMSAR